MATISAMSNNTYLMYKSAEKLSGNTNFSNMLFGSTDKTSKTDDSISKMWSNYTNAASQSAANLDNLTSLKQNTTELVNSYNDAKKTFQTDFKATMSDLKESAQTVMGMNYDFSTSDITTDNAGKTVYSDSLKNAISNVKSLISDYNDAIGLTSDYSDVSKRLKSLANVFSDTTYRADTYAKIGIGVDNKTGALSLDEDKLAKALTENGDRVKNILGSNGLAGKANNHVNLANSQQSNLFPSMPTMLGKDYITAQAYTNPKVLAASTNFSMIGSLIDMMF